MHYFVNHDSYNKTPPPLVTPGQHLWQGYIDLNFLYDVKHDFNYDNGITIIRKHPTYEEIFNFASTTENRIILSLYLNQLELLEQFIQYFQDKASVLIKQSLKKPIAIIDTQSFQQISEFEFTSELINVFNGDKLNLKINGGFINLTKRESQCLSFLLKGLSAKQIARELDISYRTVEIHCDNIRKKTGSSTRMELLSNIENKSTFERVLID